MNISLEPREVLSYLNELGYANITAHQLKDFIYDLKKLIKYELRNEQEEFEKENFELAHQVNVPYLNIKPHHDDVYTQLYKTDTVSSRAKRSKKKPETIYSIHRQTSPLRHKSPSVSRSPSRYQSYSPTSPLRQSSPSRYTSPAEHGNKKATEASKKAIEMVKEYIGFHSTDTSLIPERIETENPLHVPNNTEIDASEAPINSDLTLVSNKMKGVSLSDVPSEGLPKIGRSASEPLKTKKTHFDLTRRKSSVIRQKVIPGIPKCDPVTLYHQYKEEWSKYNIPGENRRSDLRWAVRERLVGTTSRASTTYTAELRRNMR